MTGMAGFRVLPMPGVFSLSGGGARMRVLHFRDRADHRR
jgi:hypothetical protein